MVHNFIPQGQLQTLYNAGRSMAEIAHDLNCSIHKVVYWMEKYNLPRRNRSDAGYLKLNPNGDPFKIKENLSKNEAILYGLGLGIYFGEGEKVSRSAVRVANSDPRVIKNFIKFLLRICQLEIRKISYSLVCFNDSDPDKVKIFWAEQLKISPEKFGKIVQIPTQGKGTYRRKSKFGVCTVTASNIKLKAWILEELNRLSRPT